MSSISSLKSTSLQNDIHIVNDDAIDSDIDDKAGYALGCGYIVTDTDHGGCTLGKYTFKFFWFNFLKLI